MFLQNVPDLLLACLLSFASLFNMEISILIEGVSFKEKMLRICRIKTPSQIDVAISGLDGVGLDTSG